MNKRIYLIYILFIGLLVSCSKDVAINPDQVAFDAADGIKGAQIYDHPLNYASASQTDYPNAQTNFWRCKSCHGWDLRGQSGVLINKPSSATYPVAAAGNLYTSSRSKSIRVLFDAVKKSGGRKKGTYDATHPEYSSILTDAQIWDVVKFLKVTSHNVDDFYTTTTTGTYPTGTKTFSNIGKDGNAATGLVTYNKNCAVCHGTDGRKINIYCQDLFLGEMFRKDPHEMQHKAIWGMPNDRENIDKGCTFAGTMPAMPITDQDIRNMMVMGQDVTKFP
ncbi:MAG: c-type cytochrome [Bacteroidia bacterium]|nr:c-type cytochrome [Bacteroidia bacterium]